MKLKNLDLLGELRCLESNWHWNGGRVTSAEITGKQSIDLLNRGVAENPTFSSYRLLLIRDHNWLAHIYRYSGRPEDAIQALTEAHRVAALMEIQDGSQISLHGRLAIEIDAGLLHLPANASAALHAYAEALKCTDSMLVSNPDNPLNLSTGRGQMLTNIGLSYERMGDQGSAAKNAKLAIEEFERNSHAFVAAAGLQAYAVALRNGEKVTNALERIDAYCSRIPDTWEKFEQLTALNRVLRHHGANAGAHHDSMSQWIADRDVDAAAYLTQWERVAEKDPKGLAPLALHLLPSQPERALDVAREAASYANRNIAVGRGARAFHTLGICWLHHCDYGKALEAFGTCEEWHFGGPYIPGENFFYRAICLWHLGRHDDARAMCAKAEAWGDENGHAYATEPIRWEAKALVNDL